MALNKSNTFNRLSSFAVFAFGFATNPIIVLTLPASQVADFALFYSLASAFFSFAVWALYLTDQMASIKKVLHWLLCIALVVAFGFHDNRLLFVIYPGLIVSTDYMITQHNLIRLNTLYRYALIFTLLPFLAGSDFAVDGIVFRSAVIAIFGALAIQLGKEMHALKIRSPLPFVVLCYTAYSLPLALLPVFIDSTDFLRYWYISYQIGIAVLLKLLDYCTRTTYEFDRTLIKFAYLVATACPIPVVVYTGQYFMLLPFFLSLIMLGFAFKLLKAKPASEVLPSA